MIVADAHNDLLMCVAARTPERWAPYFAENWLPQLRAGGVRVQVLPVHVSDRHGADPGLRQALLMAEAAHRIAADLPQDVALCRTGEQVQTCLEDGRIALVLAMEGLACLGHDTALVGVLHTLGVRMASLTHFAANVLADGSGEDQWRGGLTGVGREALAEMDRCGMILDLSHLSHRGVEQALEVWSGPVLASHSGARAVRDHHRNLTDEHLDAIAVAGGLVALNCFAPFVHETEPTLTRLAEHLEYLVERIGPDKVALGPDFMAELYDDLTPKSRESRIVAGVDTRSFITGLTGPAELPSVAAVLQERGWRTADVEAVMGLNLTRFLTTHLPRGTSVD